MSLAFSNTTTELGLVQEMDSICNSNSTNHSLKTKARRLNWALDEYMAIAMSVDKPWQIDDKNFTDLSISTFNLVSGQRDYKITVDANSNEILKVHKVFVKVSASGDYQELDYVDEGDSAALDLLLNNSTQATGTPNKYNWFGNSIFLDPAPSYASTNGVKIIYQRTGSYFVSTDTTKVPGIVGIHHMYLARKASLPYLAEKGMSNYKNMLKLVGSRDARSPYYGGDEKAIEDYFIERSRDRSATRMTTPYGGGSVAQSGRLGRVGGDSNK